MQALRAPVLTESAETIAENVRIVRERLLNALIDAGRDADAAALVAASKTQPVPALQAALTAGLRAFGENRVQEAASRWPELRAEYPDLTLRLIGPLQSNKTREAVALFDAIDSIDRPKIARRVADECRAQNRRLQCLIQLNTGEEPQKAGIIPADLPDLLACCRDEAGLAIDGLMCIPPADQDPAPHFALLVKLADRHGLPVRSMGMSGDYELAARFGATQVRVGTGIFGARGQ